MGGEDVKLCECGCGEVSPLARRTNVRQGMVKGLPQRFIRGHNARLCGVEYMVNPTTGCWEWQRAKFSNGYGHIRIDKRDRCAHVIVWERKHGPVPEGMELDHLCRNRACVNPDHLEPLTHAENAQRGVGTRLKAADVASILREYQPGKHGNARDIAGRYGISQKYISALARKERWATP